MPRSDVDAITALHRFGLGPRPGDWRRIAGDPRGYVLDQVGRDVSLPAETLISTGEALRNYILARTAIRQGMTPVEAVEKFSPPNVPKRTRTLPMRFYLAELEMRYAHAVATDDAFAERWVQFWSNHLCVGARHTQIRAIAGSYEREVIRPHAFGRFFDMLNAAAHHPAMLIYLDNERSFGPTSRLGIKRSMGLNENLAREILELHTVGSDAGYSQADVTAFAKVLTGWTFSRDTKTADTGAFVFSAGAHEPGAFEVFGTRYDQEGESQGIAVLQDLAIHPSTAHHLAGKVARHFVGDKAPATLIDALAASYLDSGGDLADLARTLVTHDAAWEAPPAKILPPYDMLVAFARVTGDLETPPRVHAITAALGQRVWAPPGPNGHPDADDVWAAPDAITTRLDLALVTATADTNAVDDVPALADALFGPRLRAETLTALTRAESRIQAGALLLMSPELQRR